MNAPTRPALSMLDLVPITAGGTVAGALAQSLRTARHAEALGFTRYWVAEHHNLAGVASSATAVLVGYLAGGTQRIRVGSGGIMLPNHTPLVVAEAFGTLAELYPGRIDLGLGRAPGSDALTMRALRRDRVETEDQFPRDVAMLQGLLAPAEPGQRLVAVPGAGTEVPIWLLGSSLFSAHLAARMGLPYAFAAHFAPAQMDAALTVYRAEFQPSAQLHTPYVMVGVPVIAAPSDEEAELLASSVRERVLGILTGRRGPLQPPRPGFLASLQPEQRAGIESFLGAAVIGGPARVRDGLARMHARTAADELMITCDIFDAELRLRSLDITAQAIRARPS
ncbi:MAG: LLM class flavin-dependent oxidoreductase [Pseudomonadota bacterium]|nr:LLM class flavin-dependent oxidoreductase [Pseudomonadota bacterium]